MLRQKFNWLKKVYWKENIVWSSGYFVSSVGIDEETIRRYGQDRTPYAMLSRSLVGTIKNLLVIALPGSTKGASESMDAIFPSVLHIFKIMGGGRH